MVLADVIALTVIVASHSTHVTGVSRFRADQLFAQYGRPPPRYRDDARAVASVVFLWLGLPCTIWACAVMWSSLSHDAEKGPWSTHVRAEKVEAEEAERRRKKEMAGRRSSQRRHSFDAIVDRSPRGPVHVYEGT